jgi:hypothetical protein
MPNVMTVNSTVSCGHPPGGGGVAQVRSDAKLRVAGASVLLKDGIKGKTLTPACATVPSSGSTKCTKVDDVSSGSATKLTVGGDPVILGELLHGRTDGLVGGAPQLLLFGVANQDKLRSV